MNNRAPLGALQAPNHGSAKKKESFFWKRPLLYTTLAVAGAAAIFFVANGWGSSSTSPTPPKNPTPQPKPNQEPKGGNKAGANGNAEPVQPNQKPLSPESSANCQGECLKLNAYFEAILSMDTLEEAENYLKSMDPKMIPDAFQDKKVDYITFGKFFVRANLDSKRQECPDLTKVCPVPTRLFVMDRKFEEDESVECKSINQYVSRILKEDCDRWQLCKGKYCHWNMSRIG